MHCPGLNLGYLVQKDDLITCMCKKKRKKEKNALSWTQSRVFCTEGQTYWTVRKRTGRQADSTKNLSLTRTMLKSLRLAPIIRGYAVYYKYAESVDSKLGL